MKEEDKLPAEKPAETDKDALSQDKLQHEVKTFEETDKPHAALETPEGKNNGAEPSVLSLPSININSFFSGIIVII